MPYRASSPWTNRRMPSEVRPSITSDPSPCQPAHFDRASKSSSTCNNMDDPPPLELATILPFKGSDTSAPKTSSLSSGLIPLKWVRPHSDSPQKNLGRNISALTDPWQAHRRRPILDPHDHCLVVLLTINDKYQTAHLILLCGCLGAYEQITLVSALMSIQPSTEPTHAHSPSLNPPIRPSDIIFQNP